MEHTFTVLERSPFPSPLLVCSHRRFAINNLGRVRIVAFESDLFAYFYALDALLVAVLHSKRRALCRCWLVHWVILGSSKHWQGGQSLREENQRDSWLGRSFEARICCVTGVSNSQPAISGSISQTDLHIPGRISNQTSQGRRGCRLPKCH